MLTASHAHPTAPTAYEVGWGEADFDAAQARLGALAAIAHPRLILPTRVLLRPDGAVVVEEVLPPGASLDTVLADRGALRAGQAVWWAVGVAEALAALHRAGIVHGGLAASTVWIGDDGVRLRALGTVPHREGDDPAPLPTDDIAALGGLLAESVRADDVARVGAWAEPMTHPQAHARPTAAMVARALESCAPAEELHAAPMGIAAELRRAAQHPHEEGPHDHVARAAAPLPVRSWRARRDSSVELLPEARWWRWRRALTRGGLVAIVAVVGVALAGLAGVAAVRAVGEVASPDAPSPRAAVHGGLSADAAGPAAARAALARLEALEAGDGGALLVLTAPGSPARAEAEASSAAMTSGGVDFEGLHGTVTAVDVVTAPAGRPEAGALATVVVTIAVDDYDVVEAGVAASVASFTDTSTIELVFDAAHGWLVTSAAG